MIASNFAKKKRLHLTSEMFFFWVGLLLELDKMRDGALKMIEENEELEGDPFEMPEELDDALSDLLDDSG